MLELAHDAADVEEAVGALHALEIDGDNVEAVPKQKVTGCGVAMHQHLAIFPHAWLFAPAIAQPIHFFALSCTDKMLAAQFSYQAVEIGAVLREIHSVAVRSPIMESGKKIGQ